MSGAASILLAIMGVRSDRAAYFLLAIVALWVVIIKKSSQHRQDLAAQSNLHAKDISELGSRIKSSDTEITSLRAELDDRKKRLSVINKLGEFRMVLKIRQREIHELGALDWHKEREDGQHDRRSMALFAEIQAYFESNRDELGPNAWMDMISTDNLDRSHIPGIHIATIFHADWERMQHLLDHAEKTIAGIVSRMQSKGGVLI